MSGRARCLGIPQSNRRHCGVTQDQSRKISLEWRSALAATSGLYEVTELLGEGGMGTVWRAHHPALKRDVALKVLPDAFASDPERLARFRREAPILASLNQPNIAHVYGLEDVDGSKTLVMELVEGTTLANGVGNGPMPVDDALPIAKQIVEALEAAHERGSSSRPEARQHQDQSEGVVKVLDSASRNRWNQSVSGRPATRCRPPLPRPR